MKKWSLFHYCAVLLVASGVSSISLAQSAPARSRVTVVRVKPEMLNEFIDLEMNEVVPALKKGGVKTRTVYSTALFGSGLEYTSVTPFDKFAEFDGESPPVKALGAAGAARLEEKLRKCIVSVNSFMSVSAPDLSNVIETSTPPRIIIATRFRVANGKMPEFENLIKTEVLPGFKAKKIPLAASHRSMGANPNDIVFITPVASYSEMDLGSAPVRALGQEAVEKLGSRVAPLATNVETIVRIRVPDLSF